MLRIFKSSLSLLATLALIGALSGCGGRNPYPATGDSAPHPAVARAHMMPVQGIDVSKWQGDIDWNAVRGSGMQFAFIKATEGGDYVDPRFQENWHGAARAGVPRSAYHFMYWCRPVHEQAMWFMMNVPQDPSALPPVLDLEWNGHSKTCPQKVSREEALYMTQVMLAAMQAHTGKRPIIYTDITFHKEVLEGAFNDHAYWLRSVAAEPHERYQRQGWHFWQFTATGRVPGVQGNVDRNAFAGSHKDWLRFIGVR